MGSPVIYLSGSTAVGRDAEKVAEVLSSYVNMAVRQSSCISRELIRSLEKSAKQQEPAPISGTGWLGRGLASTLMLLVLAEIPKRLNCDVHPMLSDQG
jgi:hypothetical protein